MGLCGEMTGEIMDMCHSEKDNFVVFKQIAWNLAHICDQLEKTNNELAEANRLNSRTIEDICRTIDNNNKEEKKDAPGLKADINLDSLGLGDNCFICGGELDYENIGGVIVDGYGATYCACGKCRSKFGNMLSVLLMPNEMYF